MRHSFNYLLSFGVSVMALLALTSAAVAAPDAAGWEFFEKSVRPILVKHCYECHSAADANGGLALDSRDGVLKGGDSGAAIKAGDPEHSRLIEAVRYKNPDLQMPPKNKLAPAEVAALEKWITLGAPDPRETVKADGPPAPLGMSIADGRKFWSFRVPHETPLPEVRSPGWVRTPIDAFILARLEAAGLQPAPPADKATLLRRITFDLTGLPPTRAELAAFLTDESSTAYERVVERLLGSPEYGVRWARHWLDVARYADSNGLDENLAFGHAWRYRDYVVDAFNSDRPYDQFVIEQVAGDLLPNADVISKTATGFLSMGAKVLAEPDREKLEMDTIDEQLDTCGKALLGMTLGCARCHDHKFDPIKQADYYALAAIFKGTRTLSDGKGSVKSWHEYALATDADREQLKPIEAEIAAKKKAAASYKAIAIERLRNATRNHAADYLVACAQFEPSMPLPQVEAIAAPLGLHARVLHQCRLHLEYHRDDPFFARWYELAAAGELNAIGEHYRTLFADAETAWTETKKQDPKATKLADERLETARAALHDPDGFLALPSKAEFALDPATLAEYHQLAEAARVVESAAPDLPGAMGVSDGSVQTSVPIHIRGNHRNLGQPVSRGFPEVMKREGEATQLPADHSGRLELARWLVDPEHPLTSRVYVNRLWRWHFGAGLVASTENFGALGERPSHPELLDWLARKFVQSGWSTKAMHRLLVLSNTYQMASSHPQALVCAAADPENRWLWKFRLVRLEAEAIRDSILAVTGRLDRTHGGKTVPLRNRQYVFDHTSIDHTKYDSLRRAIYLPVIRNNLYPLFEQFDFPDPTTPTGNRNATVVAPQALLMLNADLVIDSASAWAEQLTATGESDTDRIRAAYEQALARSPSQAELHRATDFLASETAAASTAGSKFDGPAARRHAWSLFCQSLLASNEFIYLR